ncbi:carboxylating nicotinate-nucleotide diphosphorylase [Sporosarcina sp. 179-K 3D1 HS]|uniref:carboxylating nicotinate-nucleotide diphosphorylase n=1 Tax=Sporosarcina sp. 179-K 3D1 HS TaxID=3232169 RepID=UPI0039A1E347
MNTIKLRSMLEQFYIEDIGDQDVSSDFLFPEDMTGQLEITAKEDGIFCGMQVIQEGLHVMDPNIIVNMNVKDGDAIAKGDAVAIASGPVRSLLKSERVILNLIQRMSAIATETRAIVRKLEGTAARVCDTRKTVPGLRMLDKYAVRVGGGVNHRYGLYDAVMLKDNHIAFAGGSIEKAVETVRSALGHTIKIEVEIETMQQLKEAIAARADIIMFDNCTPETIKEWIGLVPNTVVTEASGNINSDNIRAYAEAGVDMISLGYLTHSVKALDLSANVSFITN